MSTCVQFGAGFDGPESWLNFDSSPTLRLQRLPLGRSVIARLAPNRPRFSDSVAFGDVVMGLPVADSSAELVYCSHVLEHLSLEDGRAALQEVHRILTPGGTFRMVLPDLEAMVAAYANSQASDRAHLFMQQSYLGSRPPRTARYRLIGAIGNAAHQWLWDARSLTMELEAVGFVSIRSAAYGDAEDPRFAEVERPDRWAEPNAFGDEPLMCLGLECRRSRD